MSKMSRFELKIKSLIKRFKVQELSEIWSEIFKEFSYEDVEKQCERFKLECTPSFIAEVVFLFLQEKPLDSEDQDTIVLKLSLLDSFMHKKQSWHAAELVDSIYEQPEDLIELKRLVLRSYRTKSRNAIVYSVFCWDIIWTVVQEKLLLKSGKMKLGPPTFFAFQPESLERILYSPKNDSDHLDIFVTCLGFTDYQKVDLTGTDPENLFKLFENQQNNLQVVPVLPGIKRQKLEGGEDLSGYQAREKFADEVFYGSSRLKHLIVQTQHDGYTIRATFKAKSSVEAMFKHMVVNGAIKSPVPEYILNIGATTSNFVEIKDIEY